jgi:hypothetical protein
MFVVIVPQSEKPCMTHSTHCRPRLTRRLGFGRAVRENQGLQNTSRFGFFNRLSIIVDNHRDLQLAFFLTVLFDAQDHSQKPHKKSHTAMSI